MTAPARYSTDHFALRLGLFYAAYFLFGGIQLPYFPLWLEARGFDASGIGIAIAVPMIVRVIVVPIASHQADRFRALKPALIIAAAGGTLTMTAVGLLEGVIAILVAFTIAAMFFSPALSITDAYALSGLRTRGRPYGPVRLWGSVAFIAGNVGAGLLLEWIAPGHLIWLIVAALAAATVAAVALAPLDIGPPEPAGEAHSLAGLLGSPAFIAVAAGASLIQGSHALLYGFSTLDWRAAGISGPMIGVLWGIGVVAEIVLFALSARIPVAFGPTLLMATGAAGALVRWVAMAFDPPVAALPALQLLHAASFGATHLGTMGYLARAVPRQFAATAQGAAATVSGIVMAAATGLSGWLYGATGSLAYLAMAAMALAGLGCALAARRWWKAEPM
jgi:PPP family 3-phenylpropionic acid transporter